MQAIIIDRGVSVQADGEKCIGSVAWHAVFYSAADGRHNKAYCNRFCGRGQLLQLLGGKLKLSRNALPPAFLRSRWFRYGFLIFFLFFFGDDAVQYL